jgi:hypothetical protein
MLMGAIAGAGLSMWFFDEPAAAVFAAECAALLGAGIAAVFAGDRRGFIAIVAAIVWYAGVFAAVVTWIVANISH